MLRAYLRKIRRRVQRALGRDVVRYRGVDLPPSSMRYCGAQFRDDATFLSSSRSEARRLLDGFGLAPDSRVLEIGCGPGRLPIGIVAELGEIARYDGVDIDPQSVDWCRRHITRRHPSFRFHLIDARHERYNPDGTPMGDGFALPFADDSFDIVYLHSVFANMEPNDVAVYCREFARVLTPQGQVFLTAFIEDDVPPVTLNPEDYLVRSSGALNVARYERSYFFDIVAGAGLQVARFAHGADLGGQSIVHLSRAQAATPQLDRVAAG